METCL